MPRHLSGTMRRLALPSQPLLLFLAWRSVTLCALARSETCIGLLRGRAVNGMKLVTPWRG